MRPVLPAAVVLAALVAVPVARAQDRTAGAVTLGALVAGASTTTAVTPATTPPSTRTSTDFGGLAMADMWADVGPLRVGAALGVMPMTSEDPTRARVLLPFGASVGVAIHDEGSHLTVEPRLRGGLWAGATDFGLAVDVWGAAGLWVGYDLGRHVVLYVGMDVFVVHAQDSLEEDAACMAASNCKAGYGTFVFFSPGLSLSWTP